MAERRVSATEVDEEPVRTARYGVPRQLAQWGALGGRCGETIVVDGIWARHR